MRFHAVQDCENTATCRLTSSSVCFPWHVLPAPTGRLGWVEAPGYRRRRRAYRTGSLNCETPCAAALLAADKWQGVKCSTEKTGAPRSVQRGISWNSTNMATLPTQAITCSMGATIEPPRRLFVMCATAWGVSSWG